MKVLLAVLVVLCAAEASLAGTVQSFACKIEALCGKCSQVSTETTTENFRVTVETYCTECKEGLYPQLRKHSSSISISDPIPSIPNLSQDCGALPPPIVLAVIAGVSILLCIILVLCCCCCGCCCFKKQVNNVYITAPAGNHDSSFTDHKILP